MGVTDCAGVEPIEPAGERVDPGRLESVLTERCELLYERLTLFGADGKPEAADGAERVSGQLSHAGERLLGERP